MRSTSLCLVATIALAFSGLAACSQNSTDGSAASTADHTNDSGFRGVAFGMTPDEASKAYSGGLVRVGPADFSEESCYFIGPGPSNYDIGYMVVDGTVERVDIRTAGIKTDQGAEVGMLVGDVQALYPQAEIQPNKYDSSKSNIIVTHEDETKTILEEGDYGQIRAYRIGVEPAVSFVEGCA